MEAEKQKRALSMRLHHHYFETDVSGLWPGDPPSGGIYLCRSVWCLTARSETGISPVCTIV